MPRAMRSIGQARQNLEQSIPVIRGRYEEGVRDADWESGAGSDQAESNYADGVSEAVGAKRRQMRVREVGNAHYQNRALTKGAPAIAEGVRRGLDNYERNFGAVLREVAPVIQGLPPRTRDVNSNIDSRVKPVANAFRDARLKS